jgi:hypothetical protein
MSTKKEHWATRLKRERAELEAEVRELVLRPDSEKSHMIRCRARVREGIHKMLWIGNYGSKGGGIAGQVGPPFAAGKALINNPPDGNSAQES